MQAIPVIPATMARQALEAHGVMQAMLAARVIPVTRGTTVQQVLAVRRVMQAMLEPPVTPEIEAQPGTLALAAREVPEETAARGAVLLPLGLTLL